jgi:uncharacterized protein (DUF2141 family)
MQNKFFRKRVWISGLPGGLVITGLIITEYAISAFHDENQNGKLDRGMMGQPKEGLALSNMDMNQNRRERPTFNKAKFRMDGAKPLSLSVKYF